MNRRILFLTALCNISLSYGMEVMKLQLPSNKKQTSSHYAAYKQIKGSKAKASPITKAGSTTVAGDATLNRVQRLKGIIAKKGYLEVAEYLQLLSPGQLQQYDDWYMNSLGTAEDRELFDLICHVKQAKSLKTLIDTESKLESEGELKSEDKKIIARHLMKWTEIRHLLFSNKNLNTTLSDIEGIESMPDTNGLVYLTLSGQSIIKSLEPLKSLRYNTLYLDNCKLNAFPDVFDKSKNDLENLALGNNPGIQIEDQSFENFKRLMWLDLRNNKLTTLPSSILKLPILKTLLLQDNQLTDFPIEKCITQVPLEINLAGNPIPPETQRQLLERRPANTKIELIFTRDLIEL